MSLIPYTLFTPGPLNTSETVKAAMCVDLGSRDETFINILHNIREHLLNIAQADKNKASAILMQGSGTFAMESVLSSAIGKKKNCLILSNGDYGERIALICERLSIPHDVLRFDLNKPFDLKKIRQKLIEPFTHLAFVHCETASGQFNQIEALCKLAKEFNLTTIVDAMSSFGGIEINFEKLHIDFLISSSNKCLEGLPGCGFIITKLETLRSLPREKRSLSLDLFDQWQGFETNGQFRFTPPVQVLLGLNQALIELDNEGGVHARQQRYQQNYQQIKHAFKKMGFRMVLPDALQGHIISAFYYPDIKGFSFENFYAHCRTQGYVIYPGKKFRQAYFRIGHIGQLTQHAIDNFIETVHEFMSIHR